ncbi:MAG: addiction module toxin RelE [Lachnospiraceae bacterium]|nr:addiction module toxin RelE [Lachnospiraceae bacterium]
MTRTFIQTDEFIKNWNALGFNDDDLRRLEYEIMKNPQIGVVIPGTGKLRKMRFAYENRGKSSSTRVCYVDFLVFDTVYLVTAYAKNKKENLSKEECSEIKKFITCLERTLKEE